MSEQRRKLAEQIVEFYKLAPHYKDKSSYGTIPRDREQQAYNAQQLIAKRPMGPR